MFDSSSFANPTPLADADTSRDVLPRGGTSQLLSEVSLSLPYLPKGSVKYPDQFFRKQALRRLLLAESSEESVAAFAEKLNMKDACNMLASADVKTWMAGDAEDCGFQMLNDDEIGTSVQEESVPVDNETDEERE
ncbi:jerky-like protein [Trichonephila clavipes]|nr:jerky-like protein [Trichonephila clavipes]